MPPSDPQRSSANATPLPPSSWLRDLRVYLAPTSLRITLLGFAAGLPPLLVLGTLSFWLRKAGIDRATIGFLSWVGLVYAFKWCWAPLVDRLPIPLLTRWLGRRRSWLLLAQLMVLSGLLGMAASNPQTALTALIWCALWVSLGSATQDIALDAYRIESADNSSQAALAASYQTGYRLGMIWSGAGALWLVALSSQTSAASYQLLAWSSAYTVMAASMLIGIATVLFSPEPRPLQLPAVRGAQAWLRSALLQPFADFLQRYRSQALLILALIACYRISDVVMGIMANTFYVDMGYSEGEIAAVIKIFGVVMTLLGAFVGGSLSMRFGVMRVLMLGALLSAATNLLFAWLATRGHDLHALIWVVSADNLSSGIASAAFIAYLSSLTNIQYSATQYALFSSMMLLAPKWVAGFSGVYVNAYGYVTFFASTALLGLPVLLLVWRAAKAAQAQPVTR
jgi:PAT family beta-lactamase induction signal transducer AmpG